MHPGCPFLDNGEPVQIGCEEYRGLDGTVTGGGFKGFVKSTRAAKYGCLALMVK